MLSLLIADDEKIIRESLAECFDWAAIGIRVVGCCANGLEALDTILDETPDIVMTDIKMPGLDGLELIEKMQEIDCDMEFIILSGYREFDFAHKAISLGVRRYLLKPVSEEQVLESVLDAMNSCEKKRLARTITEEDKLPRQHIGWYYRRQLQAALFCGEISVEQAVAPYLERFPSQGRSYSLLSISALALEDGRRLARSLTRQLTNADFFAVTDFLFAGDVLMGILKGTSSETEALVEECMASVSVAAPFTVFESVSVEACAERLRREMAQSASIYAIDEGGRINQLDCSDSSLDAMRQLPRRLLALIQVGEKEDAKTLIQAHISPSEALHVLRAMGAYLISSILVEGQFPDIEEGNYESLFGDIYLESEQDSLVDKIVKASLMLLCEEKNDNYLVQAVKSYVKNNLADSSLSLRRIAADHVHVNADYLSRLFVQKTGEKFSHYLNRKRVETAKRLLQADSSKIYQVAEHVGLGHNPRYFGQVFKKHTGMTPSAYAGRQANPE